jgi:hypothetical protein
MIPNVPDEWTQRQIFHSELLNEETIQWVGQPDPSIIFTKSDIFLVPFSLIWGGFAIFWEVMALGFTSQGAKGEGAPLIFPLFGIPFVAIGLYIIFGRFLYKSWRKRRTYYAITDKRILILILGKGRNVQAMFIRDIPTINKSINSRGQGTIVFGNINLQTAMYTNTGMDYLGAFAASAVPAFYDIRDANTAYEIVNRLRNQI